MNLNDPKISSLLKQFLGFFPWGRKHDMLAHLEKLQWLHMAGWHTPCDTDEDCTVGWGMPREWLGKTHDGQPSRTHFLPHQPVCKEQGQRQGSAEG
jgi:hypothetical protein